MRPSRAYDRVVSSTATLEQLAVALSESREAWVRLAATQGRELRVLEVTLGLAPPAWRELNWTYPTARLVAFRTEGQVVAKWLVERTVKALDVELPLEGLGSNAIGDRRQSRAETTGHEPLAWPYDEWTVSITTPNSFSDELISTTEAPSFSSFERAAANLLGLTTVSPTWSLRGPEFFVRRQDARARIAHVLVDSTSVDVHVEGEQLDDVIIELAGDLPGEARRLVANEPHTERFELPTGLPFGAWVLLRRDGMWLDRRSISVDRRLRPEAGVEYAHLDDNSSADTPFPLEEQARIQQATATVKTLLRAQLELEPTQLAELDAGLDGIAAASSRLSRHEWKLLVYGTLADLVANQVIPGDVARTIFGLLLRELHHLLALPLPLPLLG